MTSMSLDLKNQTMDEDLRAILNEFDLDGSGSVNFGELMRAAELLKSSRHRSKALLIFGIVITILLLITASVVVVMTQQIVEANKDTVVGADGTLDSKDTGETLFLNQKEVEYNLNARIPDAELSALNYIIFPSDGTGFLRAQIEYSYRHEDAVTGEFTLELGTPLGKMMIHEDGHYDFSAGSQLEAYLPIPAGAGRRRLSTHAAGSDGGCTCGINGCFAVGTVAIPSLAAGQSLTPSEELPAGGIATDRRRLLTTTRRRMQTCTACSALRCDPKLNSWSCCTNYMPCGEGEGDCDSDSECDTGTVCGDDNGRDYGAGSTYFDVCVAAATDQPCSLSTVKDMNGVTQLINTGYWYMNNGDSAIITPNGGTYTWKATGAGSGYGVVCAPLTSTCRNGLWEDLPVCTDYNPAPQEFNPTINGGNCGQYTTEAECNADSNGYGPPEDATMRALHTINPAGIIFDYMNVGGCRWSETGMGSYAAKQPICGGCKSVDMHDYRTAHGHACVFFRGNSCWQDPIQYCGGVPCTGAQATYGYTAAQLLEVRENCCQSCMYFQGQFCPIQNAPQSSHISPFKPGFTVPKNQCNKDLTTRSHNMVVEFVELPNYNCVGMTMVCEDRIMRRINDADAGVADPINNAGTDLAVPCPDGSFVCPPECTLINGTPAPTTRCAATSAQQSVWLSSPCCGPAANEQCMEGEGHCTSDFDCLPGLTCTPNAGGNYGTFRAMGICEGTATVQGRIIYGKLVLDFEDTIDDSSGDLQTPPEANLPTIRQYKQRYTLYTGGNAAFVTGVDGNALDCVSSMNSVQGTINDGFDKREWGVSLWAKTTAGGGLFAIGHNNFWAFQAGIYSTGKIQAKVPKNGGQFNKVSSDTATSGINPLDDQWHHYVFTFGPAAGLCVYYDAFMVDCDASVTNVENVFNYSFNIIANVGWWSDMWTPFFDGYLDQVRMYARELEQLHVTALYEDPALATLDL